MKIYTGTRYRIGTRVQVTPELGGKFPARYGKYNTYYELATRTDLRDHSRGGFEWGYAGSGPAQLALAILADAVGDDIAQVHYQSFKRDIIQYFNGNRWQINSDMVKEYVQAQTK